METVAVNYEKSALEHGYTDRVLRIDLTTERITVQAVPEEMRRMFVGGRGYCLKLVYDGTTSATRYDSPDNVLALAGGPLCGETAFAGTGKFIVGTISPLTGTFCDSNVGGHFFPLVKLAGFDAIAVTGKSSRNVLLVIDGDECRVSLVEAPATEPTFLDAEKVIGQWAGDGRPSAVAFVTSGIGAKNTFIGCINSMYYDVRRKRCRAKQAGRGGTGTVMRDKGLCGIVVKCNTPMGRGNRPADLKRVRAVGSKLRRVVRAVDPKAMSLATQGTTALIDMMNAFHLLPVNNFQYGIDERARDISGTVFAEKFFTQKVPDGCFPGCNLGCTKGCDTLTLKTGPHAGIRVSVDGPEYESAASITNLGVFDPHTILEYAWYCDEYGLDTISAGVIMGFVFEAYERDLLTARDTDGLELKWDSPETVMELLHRMARAEGDFARAAGRGIRFMKGWIAQRAARHLDRPQSEILETLSLFAMECKGLEFSMYITKESLAQQGGYGFALKGPQHDEAWLIAIDQLNRELPTFKDKATALLWFPLMRTWFNIMGLCKLPWIDVRHPEAKDTENPAKNLPTVEYYVELANATLGTDKTLDDMLRDSERCYLLHKLINLRQGFGTREHDRIPLRAMSPVFVNEFTSRRDYYRDYLKNEVGINLDGKSDDELLRELHDYRRGRYEKLADEVYEEKGFDSQGIPTDETLERLGLDAREYRDIVHAARQRCP